MPTMNIWSILAITIAAATGLATACLVCYNEGAIDAQTERNLAPTDHRAPLWPVGYCYDYQRHAWWPARSDGCYTADEPIGISAP
jgi:hypothetical protein